MKSLFGTDGIRGVAGTYPLDESTIYACARSLATQLEQRLNRPPRVVTGRDTRDSGRWIERCPSTGRSTGKLSARVPLQRSTAGRFPVPYRFRKSIRWWKGGGRQRGALTKPASK